LFKYETIETHARAFLTLNFLAIGRMCGLKEGPTNFFQKILQIKHLLFHFERSIICFRCPTLYLTGLAEGGETI
jgi:hypothetical protein